MVLRLNLFCISNLNFKLFTIIKSERERIFENKIFLIILFDHPDGDELGLIAIFIFKSLQKIKQIIFP